ncbi:centromere-associated protein E-like [Penaeus japonicus]|uniref:centromere-associated protein E-like n=1 Tax=Penaeus japonicus TaxID=27405 RepID=UPI001C70E9AD|nr:centromere-associated protein E-like [Penaeus japonicus]
MANVGFMVMVALALAVVVLLVKNHNLQGELAQNSIQHDITKKDLQSELNKEVERYQTLRNELTNSYKKLSEMEAKLKESEGEVSKTFATLTDSNNLVMSLKEEVQQKINEAAQLRDENDGLHIKIDEMNNEVLKVDEELKKLGEEIAGLKASQSENLLKLQDAEARNNELLKDQDTLSETLKRNEELSAENAHLKGIVETMQKLQDEAAVKPEEVEERKGEQEVEKEKPEEKQEDQKEKAQEVSEAENVAPDDVGAEPSEQIYDMLDNTGNQPKENNGGEGEVANDNENPGGEGEDGGEGKEEEEGGEGEATNDNENPGGEEEEGRITDDQEAENQVVDPEEGIHTIGLEALDTKLIESNSFVSTAMDIDSSTP